MELRAGLAEDSKFEFCTAATKGGLALCCEQRGQEIAAQLMEKMAGDLVPRVRMAAAAGLAACC